MYDGDKIVQLLEKGKDVISPPEFHKPLNKEYKASPCLGFARTSDLADLQVRSGPSTVTVSSVTWPY